jgi:hypothetical protein
MKKTGKKKVKARINATRSHKKLERCQRERCTDLSMAAVENGVPRAVI